MPAPIQIEPPRIGIDLDGDAVARACLKDGFNIELISRPPQKLPAGHMSENRGVRVRHGSDDAPGLLLRIETEAAVNAGHDEVETREHIVGIVERAIRQDVRFNALEDLKGFAE